MNTILTLLEPEMLNGFYSDGFWRRDTIYSLAKARAVQAPGAVAFREHHRSTCYRDLVDAADSLAADLRRHGVRPGQRVAVWLPSRLEVAIALLACSRNGYVCCPSLHRDHTVGEVVTLLTRMRAAALIVEDGYGADSDQVDLPPLLGAVESLQRVYRLPALSDTNGGETPFAGAFPDGPDSDEPDPISNPDSVVYLAFTSGTTGEPKGVMHSDNTLLANARSLTTDWRIGAESAIYTMSPLSHNLGIGSLIGALAVGAALVVHDLPKNSSLHARLMETQASFLVGVPTHAIDLLAELEAGGGKALPHLTGFRISGAAAPRDVVTRLIDHGVTPQSGYGMTESCSNNYTLPDDDPSLIVDTSGRPAPGYEIKIWRHDDPDVEAPIGEIGQIGGRGASLMLGYFDDQAATEDCFNAQGWFMTGDLGWVDAAGYIRVTGRKKELILRGGRNIYPARIEDLAMRHGAILRAAAVPVADHRLGEKVCLVVTLKNATQIEPAQILDHLAAVGLSKYDMPEYYLQLDDLPLTSSGKILKRDLVMRIEQGQFTPAPIQRRT
jgi:acyl-CoA synthetase (AMP-forming)/AMP-acid ligase II